jgi:putative protease
VENGKTGFCTLNTAKAVGEPVGVVKLFDSQSITVDTNSKAVRFATGDGICYFDKGNVLHGANVNHVEGSRLWLQSMEGVSEVCPLFRNFDIAFQKQLDNPHSAKRLIDVKMQFEATPQSVRITATDEDGIFVSQVFEKQVVKATNEAKILTTIHEQLSKSGNFTFKITDVTVIPSQPSFYTISELNSWRRNVLTKLEEKREKRYMVEKQEITKNTLPYPDLNLNFKSNVLNSLARRFYERHGVQKIALAYEAEKPAGEAELMLTRYCILRELDCCKNDKKAKRLQEPLYLENNGQRLRLSFNCTCCEMAVVG